MESRDWPAARATLLGGFRLLAGDDQVPVTGV